MESFDYIQCEDYYENCVNEDYYEYFLSEDKENT